MKTKVSIIKCSSYEELKVLKAIRKALKDIDFKIPSKKTILLKPNILLQTTPKKGVTTHPLIVNAICKILTEKHNKVIIGESGGILGKGGTKKAFQVSGIKKIADKYNIKCLSFSEIPTKKIINKNAVIEKEMFLPKILFEVDMIINLPKLKTHSMMLYTGAVKNLYGCIPGGKKQAYHAQTKTYEKFANLLLDIYENIKPQLNIVDGIVAMEGNGPTGGDLKKANIILASKNAIALDIIAEKIMGFENEVLTTNLAIKRKLFSDKKNASATTKIPKIHFKKPTAQSFLEKNILTFAISKMKLFPKINKNKCKRCGNCIEVCPTKAMIRNSKKNIPEFKKRNCITCYCCHEMCHFHAIELKRNPLWDIIMTFYKKLLNYKSKNN